MKARGWRNTNEKDISEQKARNDNRGKRKKNLKMRRNSGKGELSFNSK
jgi:hypothetical protein